jgi:hypothetical protein
MAEDHQMMFGGVLMVLGLAILVIFVWIRKRTAKMEERTKTSDSVEQEQEVLKWLEAGETPSVTESTHQRVERRGITKLFGFLYLAILVWGFWEMMITRPPPIAAQKERNAIIEKSRQQADQYKRYLCLAAAACRKYDTVRLECATAGSFKTCLRIKMGDDANYIDACSLSDGAPALPPPPDTPNALECFFRTWF